VDVKPLGAKPLDAKPLDALQRRVFLKGASMGLFAFTLGGAEILMSPGEARARGVPFRLLNTEEAETLEALGETLLPGAREAGVAHFIDQQVSVTPGEALLEARIVNVKPPYINFYRAAIGGVDKASMARGGKRFAALSTTEQHDFIDQLRQNKIEGWQGPPAGLVYFVLRSDAVDVVYGTMEGYESLGVPYMAHIEPDKRW
jgi:Gluconate 2-dehydrogenase subunit 3